MSEQSSHAKAHEAIGAYFCAFSALERELGETIKIIFRLQTHEARDTIVAALGDVAKKVNLVWSATQLAKNLDGTETSEEWKANANETMKAIFGRNDNRNSLAHSYLEPNTDGSVKITRLQVPSGVLKSKEETWTQDDFNTKISRLRELTGRLRLMKDDLFTFKITIPSGWIAFDPDQLTMNSPEGPVALRASSSS